MAATAAQDDGQSNTATAHEGARYTRVAIWLHWAIAILIIYNLVSGLLVWDWAKEFFKANRAYYSFGITSHLSSGMTVLVLTVVRIIWRLMHEPPAYPANMKVWERHAAHFTHFLLYAGMLLMPLSGWAILSAHPPAGSPGALSARPPGSPMATPSAGPAAGAKSAAERRGPPGIWWIIPLPSITPITNIGIEPGGVKPQKILHEEFAQWHKIGAYLMILLLLGHIGGALKHQFIDKEPELERMGLRRRKTTKV